MQERLLYIEGSQARITPNGRGEIRRIHEWWSSMRSNYQSTLSHTTQYLLQIGGITINPEESCCTIKSTKTNVVFLLVFFQSSSSLLPVFFPCVDRDQGCLGWSDAVLHAPRRHRRASADLYASMEDFGMWLAMQLNSTQILCAQMQPCRMTRGHLPKGTGPQCKMHLPQTTHWNGHTSIIHGFHDHKQQYSKESE